MSWSFNAKGPALEVAAAAEAECALTQPTISNDDEKALHARATHMVVVAAHGMKDKWLSVEAGGHYSQEHGHTLSISIDPTPAEEPEEAEAEEGDASTTDTKPAKKGKRKKS